MAVDISAKEVMRMSEPSAGPSDCCPPGTTCCPPQDCAPSAGEPCC